jgi:hypothetical protein
VVGDIIGRRQPVPARAGSAGALDPVGLPPLAALLAILVTAVGARRVAAQARVLGLVAWLSVCSSTTTRAPGTA